jgi:hypothetical protein
LYFPYREMSDNSSATSSNVAQQMIGVKETKIYLGKTLPIFKGLGHEIFMKLQYKKRQLSANQSILCANYEISLPTNNITRWIINFIIPNDFIIIPEFLQDFAREFIITDEVYRAVNLFHKCHFQNQIDHEDLDKAKVEMRAIFKRRMEAKNILILEPDDLMISEYISLNNIGDFDMDISQFRFKPTVLISICEILHMMQILYFYLAIGTKRSDTIKI